MNNNKASYADGRTSWLSSSFFPTLSRVQRVFSDGYSKLLCHRSAVI
jgi:hypothetical protein